MPPNSEHVFIPAQTTGSEWLDDLSWVERFRHRDGVWWADAPTPKRWHRCTPWTIGELGGHVTERCACGGIRRDGGRWRRRNDRWANR